MPGPLSWYFHHLPKPFHRVEVFANHVTQLVVPFGLLLPQPVAGVAATVMIVTQLWLVASGNFSWLNWTAIVLGVPVLPDRWLAAVLPGSADHASVGTPPAFAAAVCAVTVVVVVLSYLPVANMLSSRQVMNTSFNRWHLVNSYGAFGSVTKRRYEIVVEGTADDRIGPTTQWREYEFRGKPGDPRRRPRQFAPYHLRLDWLMWFAALSPGYAQPWFATFVQRLLVGDRHVTRLLRVNPFPDEPPRFVRASFYRYRFTSRRERAESGQWWARERVGEFQGPVSLRLRGGSGR
jgi:hypothetical protein